LSQTAGWKYNQQELQVVQEVIIRRLPEREALAYAEARGFPIQRHTLYRRKRYIRDSVKDRLNFIAYEEFASQHIEAIDTLKMQNVELMSLQSDTLNPHVKIRCAEAIRENLRLLADLYDANPFVADMTVKLSEKNDIQKKA